MFFHPALNHPRHNQSDSSEIKRTAHHAPRLLLFLFANFTGVGGVRSSGANQKKTGAKTEQEFKIVFKLLGFSAG